MENKKGEWFRPGINMERNIPLLTTSAGASSPRKSAALCASEKATVTDDIGRNEVSSMVESDD